MDLSEGLIVSVSTGESKGTTGPEVAGEEIPEALFLKEDTNSSKEVCWVSFGAVLWCFS